MTTAVRVNTATYAVTHVATNMLGSIRAIIKGSGLDPSRIREEWAVLEEGIATWLASGHLRALTLETYDPGKSGDNLVGRFDFTIDYGYYPGGDGDLWLDSDTVSHAIRKNGSFPGRCDYRLIADNAPGRPDVPGWSATAYRSTAGFTRPGRRHRHRRRQPGSQPGPLHPEQPMITVSDAFWKYRGNLETTDTEDAFDTRLFKLPWNTAIAGREPAPEDVIAAAAHIRDDTRYRGWYSIDLAETPWPGDVLLCQRMSIIWGRRDHRAYGSMILITRIAWLAVGLTVALARDLSLASYLLKIFLPSSPALLDCTELARAHWRHATRRENAEQDIQDIWQAHRSDSEGIDPAACRNIQDTAYLLRRQGPRVPDFFYRIRQRATSDAISAGAALMIATPDDDSGLSSSGMDRLALGSADWQRHLIRFAGHDGQRAGGAATQGAVGPAGRGRWHDLHGQFGSGPGSGSIGSKQDR